MFGLACEGAYAPLGSFANAFASNATDLNEAIIEDEPMPNPEVKLQIHYKAAPFVTSQHPHAVQINRLHSSAICVEIGDRLRDVLTPNGLPPYLLALAELLDRIGQHGPSQTFCDRRR